MRINTIIKLIAAFTFVIISKNTSAISLNVKGYVSSVHEASGIDFTGGSSYWTHNDGYGDEQLYKLNGAGSLLGKVTVTNATNHDWEDITSDVEKDHMYIGDFGNNDQDRRDLRIYKIPYPSLSNSTVSASVIKFSYPDQTRWPSRWWNFDAEGFFHLNGKLYIFTKADHNAIGYCKLYTLPDQPGTYVATLIDSFPISGRITGADVSEDGKKVVLISNTSFYLFTYFSGDNVFNGNYTKVKMDGGWTQKEGVCFKSSYSVYVIDEGSSNKLYSADLSSYLRLATEEPAVEQEIVPVPFNVNVYPNPATTYFTVSNPGTFENADIILSDIDGKVVSIFKMKQVDADLRVETEQLTNGVYFVQLVADGERKATSRLIVSH